MNHPRDLARSAAVAAHPVLVLDSDSGRVLYQNASSRSLFGRLQNLADLKSLRLELVEKVHHLQTRQGPRSFLLSIDYRDSARVLVLSDVSDLQSMGSSRTAPMADPLHRSEFDYILAREIARADRNLEPFQLLLLEIDQFSEIREGARGFVIDMTAELVRSTLRRVDVLGRYGAGCFSLLLPGTDSGGGLWVAERSRRLVEAAPFELEDQVFAVTVSVGLTDFREEDTPYAMYLRAGGALDRARQWGPNQIDSQLKG